MKAEQIAGILVVLTAIGGLICAKRSMTRLPDGPEAEIVTAPEPPPVGDAYDSENSAAKEAGETTSKALPKFIELGSVGCRPCTIMEPIIEELKSELRGKVDVEFIDVGKDYATAEKYRVRTIPTQVLLDADGNELDRHVGVYQKEDILANMRELGVLDE